jgi:transcriptional regulator with XRE-family HTH domain
MCEVGRLGEKYSWSGWKVDAATRFGSELQHWRTECGLTQRELAERVRYSREMVAAVERGRRYANRQFAARCDEVLSTGGRLAELWPWVESEQVAADRRRGPRPRTNSREPSRAGAGPPEPARVAEWSDRIRPAIDEVAPELVAAVELLLRELINDAVAAGTPVPAHVPARRPAVRVPGQRTPSDLGPEYAGTGRRPARRGIDRRRRHR